MFLRDGMLYAWRAGTELLEGERIETATVRYRTVGDMRCTGGVRSTATTLEAVVAEIAAARVTERGETRADDRVSEAAMEDREEGGLLLSARGLLRFTTAGSVDDGKSTLIGRLLYDTKQVLEDQLAQWPRRAGAAAPMAAWTWR